jgi:uncharacterized membrane protein
MSEEKRASLTEIVLSLIGFVLLIFGLLLVYFSLTTDVGMVDPRVFTPIGAAVTIIGAFMMLTKKT